MISAAVAAVPHAAPTEAGATGKAVQTGRPSITSSDDEAFKATSVGRTVYSELIYPIKYAEEVIRRKAGKAGAKKK